IVVEEIAFGFSGRLPKKLGGKPTVYVSLLFSWFLCCVLHSIHCRSLESLLLSRPLAKLPALWQHPARAILNSCPYDLTVAGPPPAPLPSRSSSVGQAILRYVDS